MVAAPRRLLGRCALAGVVALGVGLMAGCAQDEDGGQPLTAEDLVEPDVVPRFAGEPILFSGQFVYDRRGCLSVVIDGVERIAFWPSGSTLENERTEDDDVYTLELSDGRQIVADTAGGDSLSGIGVLADSPPPFAENEWEHGWVDSYLGYCETEVEPILITSVEFIVAREQ